MENIRRNDILYGQNWIDQCIRIRRRRGSQPLWDSNYATLTGTLYGMTYGEDGINYQRRRMEFDRGDYKNNYFLVR